MGIGILRRIFSMENLKDFINEKNPLGSKGVVAMAFKSFMNEYFTDSENRLNPKWFKTYINKHLIYFENNE